MGRRVMAKVGPMRFIYLVGCSYTLQGTAQTRAGSYNFVLTSPSPVAYWEDVQTARKKVTDHLASENPGWDAADPDWRRTVVILGCSLLRVEEQKDGKWVLREHQP